MVAILAAAAPASADPLAASEPDAAQQTYDREFVGFRDISGYDGDGIAHWKSFAYQGKYQRPLDTAEFLDAVDLPEVASQYRHAATIKRALVLSGSALLLAGGITAVSAGTLWGVRATCTVGQDLAGSCDTSALQTTTWVGVGAVAAGLALDLAGALLPQPHLEPYEMRKLADEHNQRLRERLGLVSQLGPTGGMVGLRGTF